MNATVTLEIHYCPTCGIPYGITHDFERRRREDGANFYCPAGHIVVYTDSDLTKAKREHDRLRLVIQGKDNDLANERLKQRQLIRRVKNGICPFCKRSFHNLKLHMQAKHKHK